APGRLASSIEGCDLCAHGRATSFVEGHNLHSMKTRSLALSRCGIFSIIISCLLLTALLLAITSEVRAKESPRPTPSQRGMAGNQGGAANPAQAAADDVAREIEGALAKEELTRTRRLTARFLETPG